MPNSSNINFSLEVFPPKTAETRASLMQTVEELARLKPSYMTVTYGAGGSTKEITPEIAIEIERSHDFPVAAHLTCVGASKEETDAIAQNFWDNNIRHIIALRGDVPSGGKYEPHPQGYAYAVDLVKGLKDKNDFEISVACYPELHPEAPSEKFELEYLKAKIDAGADRAISQFFFDPEVFLRFRDKAVAAGAEKPIVPGLLPILNFPKMLSFAERCGSQVPNFLHKMFDGISPDDIDHKLLAMNVLSHQITRLIEEGVEFFHIYTLNESLLTKHLCKWLRAGF